MRDRSIVIIGAGMGGLAAGIHGQANGYRTRIYESHVAPGGQAATWKRQGYSFDGCIHHLFGCRPGSLLYELWRELGAMPRDLVPTRECVAVMGADGRLFADYYDLDRLHEHLHEIAPRDSAAADEYVRAIRQFARHDFFGELIFGRKARVVGMAPTLVGLRKWFKPTMADLGARFRDPLLRDGLALAEYSMPSNPAFLHLVKHAYGMTGDIAWPVGGAAALARSMADRYAALGGELHLGQRVIEILTRDGKAVGIRLADGTAVEANVVISNADGRATIMDLLGGKFVDDRIRGYCAHSPAMDETNWAVHVFLGVKRDLSREPSALVMLLDRPVEIAGHTCNSLELQTYGMDATMAPPGKGVIKVELVSRWKLWEELSKDPKRYREEKEKAAETVIGLLEKRWPGLRNDIEVVDVPTLITWKRFMGGDRGFVNMPTKQMDFIGSLVLGKIDSRLPGLANFHLVGSWATSGGALFLNALSGRKVIREVCRADGRRFTSPSASA